MKKFVLSLVVISLLLLPVGLQFANAVTTTTSTTGSVTISGTCGITFTSGAPIAFGTLARDSISSEQTLTLNNTGSVTSTVTVSASDWKDGSNVVHIGGNLTKFATTNLGAGLAYASKTPLNSTNGAVAFGTIRPQYTNSTYWQVKGSLQNMPFKGTLTQSITFTGTC